MPWQSESPSQLPGSIDLPSSTPHAPSSRAPSLTRASKQKAALGPSGAAYGTDGSPPTSTSHSLFWNCSLPPSTGTDFHGESSVRGLPSSVSNSPAWSSHARRQVTTGATTATSIFRGSAHDGHSSVGGCSCAAARTQPSEIGASDGCTAHSTSGRSSRRPSGSAAVARTETRTPNDGHSSPGLALAKRPRGDGSRVAATASEGESRQRICSSETKRVVATAGLRLRLATSSRDAASHVEARDSGTCSLASSLGARPPGSSSCISGSARTASGTRRCSDRTARASHDGSSPLPGCGSPRLKYGWPAHSCVHSVSEAARASSRSRRPFGVASTKNGSSVICDARLVPTLHAHPTGSGRQKSTESSSGVTTIALGS